MDSSLPNAVPDDGSGTAQERLCAPLASLEVGGVAPQVGDTVQVKVEGTISEIDGDKAYIEPETVNGQPVPEQDQSSDQQDGLSGLEKKAAQLDTQSGY